MRRAAIALAGLLLLAGCGDHLDGRVTSRGVDPGYTYVYLQPITTTSCSGKPVSCRTLTTGYVPITYYVPPCYWIRVDGADDDSSGRTCLHQDRWESVRVGDQYVGDDVQPKDAQRKADR